ncbi:Zinc finger protein ZAT1 [Sesamum alatum]|uniref:Zinc finger protein ZAT1 n=1 Tax=Sesamum alatum TaxID=300844 RepID=A0AAE2CAD4_9LAMI|nr:Zinc finger protein ZAT1 [Sesamum alatum]
MEKRHRCKLCFRNFANGRALGGHMRSHMMKFYAAKMEEEEEEEEEQQPFDDFQSVRSYSSTSSSEEEEEEVEVEEEEEEEAEEESGEVKKALLSYELRENPSKSTLLVDHEFASVVLQDRESETESSKVCRRSKRVRKSRNSGFDGFSMNGGPFLQVKKSKFEMEGKEQDNHHHDYSSCGA